MRTFSRYQLCSIVLFAALAVVLTYPLAIQFADHVPGTAQWSMDEYGYVWNHWWFKFAVFERETNPFATDFLFYPLGTSLVLYTFTLLHVALALPLQFVFGLVPAINSTILFSLIISAFGMYLFVSYLLRVSFKHWLERGLVQGNIDESGLSLKLHFAAFVAGILFAFSSNKLVYLSLGHYNVIATEWIPFYLLFLIKTLLNRGWRYPFLAGLFAALALYSETTDGVLLALLTLVILFFEFRILNLSALIRVGTGAIVAGVLFAPLLVPTLKEIFYSDYQLPGWGHSEKLLVDLAGLVTPTGLNPFTRNWEGELDQVRQGISRFSDVNTFFVGYLTCILALIGGIRYFRTLKMWIAVAVGFTILSLGPLLHLNGISEFDLDGLSVNFPMPFLILHYIPIIRENRVPNRYSILAMLGLAILVAYAVYWIWSRIADHINGVSKRAVLVMTNALVLSILIGEHMAVPLPLTDARIPGIYAQIKAEPGDFAILTLPLGWRNSFGQAGAEDTRTQFYASAAQKHLLTGQIQRNPDSLFKYFTQLPVLKSLVELETYQDVSDEQRTADRKFAPLLASFFDIRYLVVNAEVPNRPPYSDNRARLIEYLQQVFPLGEKVYEKDGVLAWKVIQPALPSTTLVDFGTGAASMFRAEGWSTDEVVAGASANWVTSNTARMFFPARASTSYSLTLRALPFTYPGASSQLLGIDLNGRHLGDKELPEGWSEVNFTIPQEMIRAGLNELTFQPKYLVRPRDVLPAHFDIGTTGVESPVDILLQSTSQFASIKINGKEVSLLKRGYNIVVIDPKSGVVQVRNFDTGGSIVESRALTDFIGKLPNGIIVAGATQENAGANLGERAEASLKSLGLEIDLRANPDHTHVFVGVKGATPGSAAEAGGADDSVISIGRVADDRLLGFAVDWVRIEIK